MKPSRLWDAITFVAPLLALVVLWELLVRGFSVNPRVFPSVEAVARAAWEGVQDGWLVRHIGASLGRIAVGTVLALLTAIRWAWRWA